ncbi:hypothetical protein D6C91_10515 [Aureobasidium pullulans]|uniref:Uncharacterized protein n=1 Tax=Aureobasidium pullulans TaxID=5580 RepID=A0A4S9S5K5_AURPU|nr:hypothetical protein D6C91_10515 [Aureobasidium pullulans]
MSSLALRAQILDNWRYAHPAISNVLIITHTNSDNCTFTSMLAEHPDQGGQLLLKSPAFDTIPKTLVRLLGDTHSMVARATAGKTVMTAAEREKKAAVEKKDREAAVESKDQSAAEKNDETLTKKPTENAEGNDMTIRINKKHQNETVENLRVGINKTWQLLKPAHASDDFPLFSWKCAGIGAGHSVVATELGMTSMGETEAVALRDLLDKMSTWVMAVEWKKQADANR